MNSSAKIVCGMTHVDIAWKKTREEMEEVFDDYIIKLLDLCEQYPDFTYMLEQAYHYRALKSRRPDLFARLVPLVQEGRLEFVTGLASTIENNVTSGESFVRNMQIGRRFIEGSFDVPVRGCAMIDTFGFPPQMPQVLNQFGYRWLLANRLGGFHSEDVMNVVGLDGTKLLLAGSDILSYHVKPGHINFRYFRDYAGQKSLMDDARQNETPLQLVIPYSENEVVPCHLIPELVRDSQGEFVFGHVDEFFKALEAHASEFEDTSADLNPEFTGTFSMRHCLRQRNRCVETVLLEAEKVSALCGIDVSERIENCWWKMAYIQFHDVITGSHPDVVYQDTLEQLQQVEDEAKRIIAEGLCRQDSGCVIWNGLPFARKEIMHVPLPADWAGLEQATLDGQPITIHGKDEDGFALVEADLAPMSAHHLVWTQGAQPFPQPSEMLSDVLENEFIRIEFDGDGMAFRLVHKPSGQVMLKCLNDLLVFQKDEGSFQIEQPVHSEITAASGACLRTMQRNGAIDSAMLTGEIPDPSGAPVQYHISLALAGDSPALSIRIKVNWNSKAARLRLRLNACMAASVNRYEVPFGIVSRKPYVQRFNSRGEWPAYRFVCMEEPGTGKNVAIVNRGTCGVETIDGVFYSTLLRAPSKEYAGMVPDETSSDHGVHTFEFLVIPFVGELKDSNVIDLAQRFNNPPLIFQGKPKKIDSPIQLSGKGVVLSAMHRTNTGDIVVRIYETLGRSVSAVLSLPEESNAWASDLNELRGEALTVRGGYLNLALKPFEIKTVLFNSSL